MHNCSGGPHEPSKAYLVHVSSAAGLARRRGHCTCGWLVHRRVLVSPVAKLDALEHAACNAYEVGYPLALNVAPRIQTTTGFEHEEVRHVGVSATPARHAPWG
jgi:hypothetical protein